jgi:UPF0176 protein
VPKSIKQYIGKGTHFIQNSVSVSFNRRKQIKIGDKILIIGATTGEELIIEEMLVNEVIVEKAVAGDICTFKLPFRIRLSDRL